MEVPKKKQKSLLREYVDTAVYAVVLTLLLRVFVVQAFRIPSGSMLETLQVGDFLFVNKFEYGAKIPFTNWRLPGFGEPSPGHVIVFQYPQDPRKDYIKRCVAVGGQTVEIRNKDVIVDGVERDEPYVIHGDPQIRPAEFDPRDNFGPTSVPENALFMMGDNRFLRSRVGIRGPGRASGDCHLGRPEKSIPLPISLFDDFYDDPR